MEGKGSVANNLVREGRLRHLLGRKRGRGYNGRSLMLTVEVVTSVPRGEKVYFFERMREKRSACASQSIGGEEKGCLDTDS